jgi:hypothetical protein
MPTSTSRRILGSPATAVALLSAIGMALRLTGLSDKPFWSAELQEVFNARCAAFLKNLPDSGSDVLGFLWHNLVWRLDLTPLELWDRLPSALLGVLFVPLCYAWGAELHGRRAGLVAAVMACCSVLLVDLSQAARFYGTAALAGNAATLALLKALRAGRSDWKALLPFWAADAAALLSHGLSVTFLLVQGLVVLYVLSLERRMTPAAVVRQGLRIFLPVAPPLLLEVLVVLGFRAKMMGHQTAFLVGRPYGVAALVESVAVGLSGGFGPLWVVFGGLVGVGLIALWYHRRTSLVASGASLAVPLVVLAAFAATVSGNAFDMTFVSFLCPAAYAAAGAAVASMSVAIGNRKVAAAACVTLLALFVASNAWMLHAYYRSPVKPVLGADFRSVSRMLASANPGKDDILLYRYDEYFTHMAFYSAYELQLPQLVAEVVPPHSRGVLFEYLHRLNGCSDRPRVTPDRVRDLADMEASRSTARGRLFVVLSCPLGFGDSSVETEAGAIHRALPDFATWVQEAGVLRSTCDPVAARLSGFTLVQFPGVVVAWKDVQGRRVADVAAEMRAVFAALPAQRLRLQPR